MHWSLGFTQRYCTSYATTSHCAVREHELPPGCCPPRNHSPCLVEHLQLRRPQQAQLLCLEVLPPLEEHWEVGPHLRWCRLFSQSGGMHLVQRFWLAQFLCCCP